ncbi:MAG: S8 family serine peptidase [Planctomycetota bacterium]
MRKAAVICFVILSVVRSGSAEKARVSPAYAPDELLVKLHGAVAQTVERQLGGNSPAGALRLTVGLDELNARYRVSDIKPVFKDFKKNREKLKGLLRKDRALLTRKERHLLRRLARAPKEARVPDLSRIYKLKVELEPGQSLEEVVAGYNADPDVEYAEFNYIVSIDLTPDDPLYSIQWPLNNTGQMYPASGKYNYPPGTPDCDIDAPEAWDIETGSWEVIIAVVDTGVDYSHRDLDDNMWTDGSGHHGYDFINNDNDPMDDRGHGTHCAGTIAAEGDNGLDIAGVCWNAKIMALKFLGSDGRGDTEDAVLAFYYAVENGAEVVSNSWGGGDHSHAAQEAIDYAYSQGVIMVASAGNGDTDEPQYPAYYNHMISVAATDSDDQKAGFSNYGDWVDIAAPGVDVLSLRASGTSMGTTYDEYTTIASGTSMACPHVAGACVILLSIYPETSVDEMRDILQDAADPIAPGICQSGRLNLRQAALQIIKPKGTVWLSAQAYSCSAVVGIEVRDSDLNGAGIQDVTVTTDDGDLETVLLNETSHTPGLFTGTISTSEGEPTLQDATLPVGHGQIITVTYQDANDGTGSPATAEDSAIVDCEPPGIFNLQIDVPGPEPTVTFQTDEGTMALVLCGAACGGPYFIETSDWLLSESHTITITGVSPETDYFFVVEATDEVGNATVEDNYGLCYPFTTTVAGEIYVPSQCPTIQGAVDDSWDGGTVLVADGTYAGAGNRDIDFKGKAITVRSENGPENCIIDCGGSEFDRHCGFKFLRGEDGNSVLEGFTITNGYAYYGGGIYCEQSSPTIINCILSENVAERGGYSRGGGLYCTDGNVLLIDCTFIGNSAEEHGGAVACEDYSSPTVTNCTFSGNIVSGYHFATGGGMYCSSPTNPVLTNCVFSNNVASGGSAKGGGLYFDGSGLTLVNCVFSGNRAGSLGAGILFGWGAVSTVSNCTFTGNFADDDGGGIYTGSHSNIRLTNCILWGDTPREIGYSTSPVITYSNVQRGWPGVGNVDLDPRFVAPGYWDGDTWVDGDYHLQWDSPCANAGDPAGDYTGQTDIDGEPRVMNGRVEIGVDELNIQTPIIQASATELEFWCIVGSSNPEAQIVCIRNSGIGTLNWVITYDCEWLSVSSLSGESAGECDDVTLSVDITGMPAGTYRCVVAISASGAVNSPETVEVDLLIGGAMLLVPQDYTTIQDAIDAAIDGDTVIVADGTYTGQGNRDISFKGKTIAVQSESGPDASIIDCQSAGRAFTFNTSEEGDSILDGFTIANGKSSGFGGGIYIKNSSPTITNCRISNCQTTEIFGGGIYCENGAPRIRWCVISDNSTGQEGGGIHFRNGGYAIVENCMIINNRTPEISEYQQDMNGGGICCRNDDRCHATIRNCLIAGNYAGRVGGGIYLTSTSTKVYNCTISDNSAASGGAAIYFDCSTSRTPTLKNSILWYNSPDQIQHSYSVSRITYNDIQGGWTGMGNINANPMFVSPANGDYHLRWGSPCTNAGNPSYVPAEDEEDVDGEPRVMGGRVDMGIDEVAEGPLIEISAAELRFCAKEGAANPAPQTFFISNSGRNTLNWQITEDCSWLEVTPSSGESTGELDIVTLTTHIGGLALGNYTCELTVSDADAANSPQTVLVNLDVVRPQLSIEPNAFEFWANPEGPNPAGQIMSIRNTACDTLAWEISLPNDSNWLQVYPLAGQCTEEIDEVVLSVDVAALPEGDCNCVLTVSAANTDNSPQTVYVDLFANTVFEVPSEQYPTIQAGIDAASDGDVVVVAAGTYTGPGNRDLDFGGKVIMVTSENPDDPAVVGATVIDCQSSGRAFYFHSGETSAAAVRGLTITNGYASYGGAVYCDGGSPTISKCTFSGNNAALEGGAIQNDYCSPTVAGCTFAGNNGSWSGGAMSNFFATPTVKSCIFSGNSGDVGGAIMNHESDATFTNCTFSGNAATMEGGAINNSASSGAQVSNCILWGDSAGGSGPEIYGDCVVSYSDVQGGWAGTGNIDADPMFVDAVGGDYHLLGDSPAIDAGDPTSDCSNEPWPNGFRVNMGAYGNASEATRSPAGFRDLAVLGSFWLSDEPLVDIAPQPDGDGIANFLDFAVLVDSWLRQP